MSEPRIFSYNNTCTEVRGSNGIIRDTSPDRAIFSRYPGTLFLSDQDVPANRPCPFIPLPCQGILLYDRVYRLSYISPEYHSLLYLFTENIIQYSENYLPLF